MQRFSDETEQVLRDSGWQPGRRVDIQLWIQRLEGSGIIVHESAEKFLAEFGGLAVEIDGPGHHSRAHTLRCKRSLGNRRVTMAAVM